MRLETSAVVDDVAPGAVFAVAADLRNLPAWWIEHLHAEVVTPAARLRDTVYRVRYRLPWGQVISATCTVMAARGHHSLTYVWVGGGMRMAVGQGFIPAGEGTEMRLVADLRVGWPLAPLAPVLVRLMRRELRGEIDRALATLAELAAARAVMRRGGRLAAL
ncbi:MAG TPA: SRPBCC family protein [Candidatus Dormibacteraeota bacterium]